MASGYRISVASECVVKSGVMQFNLTIGMELEVIRLFKLSNISGRNVVEGTHASLNSAFL